MVAAEVEGCTRGSSAHKKKRSSFIPPPFRLVIRLFAPIPRRRLSFSSLDARERRDESEKKKKKERRRMECEPDEDGEVLTPLASPNGREKRTVKK